MSVGGAAEGSGRVGDGPEHGWPADPYPATDPGPDLDADEALAGQALDLPPDTSSAARSWLLIGVVGFLVGQLAGVIMLAAVAAANGHTHDYLRLSTQAIPPGWIVVCELVGLWIGFIGAVVLASRTRGTGHPARDMGLAVRGSDLVVGPLVGLAGQFLLLPLLYLPLRPFIPHLNQRLAGPSHHLTGGFPGADLVIIGALTVLVVPVVEELLFRGLLLRALLRLLGRAGRILGPALACLCTGILFGLAHFQALQLLGLATFGVVLSYLAYRQRRLGPSILAHATFNLVAIVAVARGTVH